MYNKYINNPQPAINYPYTSINQALGYTQQPTMQPTLQPSTVQPVQDAWVAPDYSNQELYGTVTPMEEPAPLVAPVTTTNMPTISGALNGSQNERDFFSWQDSKPRQIANQAVNNFKQMSFMDKTKAIGNTLGTLANAYMGYKNYKLAKDQLAFSKEAYNTNLQNQRKMVNSQLEDRQARRVRENIANGKASGPSVSEYMAKYGV